MGAVREALYNKVLCFCQMVAALFWAFNTGGLESFMTLPAPTRGG